MGHITLTGSGFVSASLKCFMLDWNCCLSTNSHWTGHNCNLVFSVMHLKLDTWTNASFCGQADYMHWIVDKMPDQSILNTAGWRYIVPQLYKQYPNDDMNINISVSSPPIIKVAKDDISAFVNLDVTIDVNDAGEVIPVACISLVNSFEISVCRSCYVFMHYSFLTFTWFFLLLLSFSKSPF